MAEETSDLEVEAAEIEAQERALAERKKKLAKANGDESESDTWTGKVVTFDSREWEIKTPNATAVAFLVGMTSGRKVAVARQQGAAIDFLTRHMSEKSFDELDDRINDPDQPEFDIRGFLEEILKGVKRPT